MDENEITKRKIGGEIGLSLGTLVVGALLLRGCVVGGIQSQLEDINYSLQNQPSYELQLKTENVLGNEANEEFYEIDGNRAYLKIDGKPNEDFSVVEILREVN